MIRRSARTRALALLLLALTSALAAGTVAGVSQGAPDAAASAPVARSKLLADPNAVGVVAGLPQPPIISAPEWAVYDARDDTLLAGRNVGTVRATASLAKLVTALVVLARTTGTETVVASHAAQLSGDGSEIDMKTGQKFPVETLLRAMLVHSANDAAVALAEHVGGDEAGFVALEQQKVRDLKLEHTTITNSTGLDQGNPPTSTASDIYQIAKAAMADPRVRTAVTLPSVTVPRSGEAPVVLTTRDELLGTYPGVDGIKTGFTALAGNNLALRWTAPAGSSGQLYIILMGDPTNAARWADARALLDWATPLRQHLPVADAGTKVASVPVSGTGQRAGLYIVDDIKPELRVGMQLTERFVIPRTLQPPLRAGQNVGRYELLASDKVVATSDLYIAKSYGRPTRSERIRHYAAQWRAAARAGVAEARHESHTFLAYWGYA